MALVNTNTDVTPVTAGPLSIDSNGVITLQETLQLEHIQSHTVCEEVKNCASALYRRKLLRNTVVNDGPTTVTVTISKVVLDVTTNDNLNGVKTSANTDVTPAVTGPLSKMLNVFTLAQTHQVDTYVVYHPGSRRKPSKLRALQLQFW
jgi:hypothetical protein